LRGGRRGLQQHGIENAGDSRLDTDPVTAPATESGQGGCHLGFTVPLCLFELVLEPLSGLRNRGSEAVGANLGGLVPCLCEHLISLRARGKQADAQLLLFLSDDFQWRLAACS
jgi:hypothetical protein